ncbi:hypothetical protein Patl1_16761 [Pistacia atlantica]|uniref:Uncharacterized protein n=1 Tax=Pistacia atlantica TaxID=434234 RepID=A0ACC1BBF1_9ROSI|nr:hypothetical protein Patl1_16761 [Pistacia atlantica]
MLSAQLVLKTDVSGVYDRPPTELNAVLLREIAVAEDGSWSVMKPVLQDINKQVALHLDMPCFFPTTSSALFLNTANDKGINFDFTVAAHDTTGGMEAKISEAAMIAKLGIDVYIVQAATSHSLRALRGELRGNIPDDWLGTVIRFLK